MTRQPAAIFIVDIIKEHIALNEAKRLNIPTFAMVDTNSNPKSVDFPIPANDDASKSISIIMDTVCAAIKEGLAERKNSKDVEAEEVSADVEETPKSVKAEIVDEETAEAIVKKAPAKKAPAVKKVKVKADDEAEDAE